MILQDIALLAADTARTKAYLQRMIAEDRLPAKCIVYVDDLEKLRMESAAYDLTADSNPYFKRDIPLLHLLEKADIDYITIQNRDINSQELEKAIREASQKYLIYSGYGGQILKPHLFRLGKEYIHVHAGILPYYRGSTTAYYSLLQENYIGATAIFLSEGIDEGNIITEAMFQAPVEYTDIDYIYEPFVRSCVLLKALDQYVKRGTFESKAQESEKAETYYIIHPVLKHLALTKLEENTEGNKEHT